MGGLRRALHADPCSHPNTPPRLPQSRKAAAQSSESLKALLGANRKFISETEVGGVGRQAASTPPSPCRLPPRPPTHPRPSLSTSFLPAVQLQEIKGKRGVSAEDGSTIEPQRCAGVRALAAELVPSCTPS